MCNLYKETAPEASNCRANFQNLCQFFIYEEFENIMFFLSYHANICFLSQLVAKIFCIYSIPQILH